MGKHKKTPKRRTIEPKKPIAQSHQQKIRSIIADLQWLDREEERLLAEQNG